MKHLILISVAILLISCTHLSQQKGASAVAILQPTQGNTVTGTVHFVEYGGRVKVTANVQGLKPGLHGFHIHEKGDCSAPDATSAGGHFNPHAKNHGSPSGEQHHGGDFGNLNANDQGEAIYEATLDGITLSAGSASIIGRGIIVHANPDDLATQPTGNSGARIACAVIK